MNNQSECNHRVNTPVIGTGDWSALGHPDVRTDGEVIVPLCTAAALLGWHDLHCRALALDQDSCPISKHAQNPNDIEIQEEVKDLL